MLKEHDTIEIKLTVAELMRIGFILGKEPFNDVAELLMKIRAQFDAQNAKRPSDA